MAGTHGRGTTDFGLTCAWVLACAGCGGTSAPTGTATDAAMDAAPGDGTLGDGGATADVDAFVTGAHTAWPQVPDQGGPRITHPQLVTVTFAGDPHRADVEAYATWLAGSSWLTTVGQEYGVGAGTVLGAVVRPETPPAAVTSMEIEHMLALGVLDGSIPRPAGDALNQAIYLVYYPVTTAITTTFVNGIIKHGCTDFGAYHGEVNDSGLRFAYAVVPECNGLLPGLTQVQTWEMAISHEVIEAATDARPVTAPAFQLHADPTEPWFTAYQFEVEVGDLCESPPGVFHDGMNVAQRTWSNAAAATGGDPCIPADRTVPYYNTAVTPTVVQHLAPGASVDYVLQPWSTGPGAPWRLSTSKRGTLNVATTVTPTLVNNGDTATLHVTAPADAAPGSTVVITLVSRRSTTDYHTWVVPVVSP